MSSLNRIFLFRKLYSYLHFYTFTVLPHAVGMASYALLPSSLYLRLFFLHSSLSQLFYILFGRLCPRLPFPTANLTGKTCIVTGANSGIGFQLASSLTSLGASVLLIVRSEEKGRDAVKSILSTQPEAKGRVKYALLDTSNLDSVREFAKRWVADGGGRIDVLMHNAGAVHANEPFTEEGLPSLYVTNFLSSFLLTYLLMPYLATGVRVVFTSSTGQLSSALSKSFSTHKVTGTYESGYHIPALTVPFLGWKIHKGRSDEGEYAQTKAMQCAFARALQSKFDSGDLSHEGAKESGSDSNRRLTASFTPGFTSTAIFTKFGPGDSSFWKMLISNPNFAWLKASTWMATDVREGAMTGLWLAVASEEEIAERDVIGEQVGAGGGFWDRTRRIASVADLMSEEKLERLWRRWEIDADIEW